MDPVWTCAEVFTELLHLGAIPACLQFWPWRMVSLFGDSSCHYSYNVLSCFSEEIDYLDLSIINPLVSLIRMSHTTARDGCDVFRGMDTNLLVDSRMNLHPFWWYVYLSPCLRSLLLIAAVSGTGSVLRSVWEIFSFDRVCISADGILPIHLTNDSWTRSNCRG